MGFGVLGIAQQAIAAQQLALDVTGNNMANATTPGYHGESVDLTENAPAPNAAMPSTLIGNGVTATAVSRATNTFLSASVRNQASAVGYATALTQGLNQVQSIFQEPQNGGLAEMMNQFNQSWLSLSQNPTSLSARQTVIQDGQTLASTFNSMSSYLANEETSVNQNITTQVQQINQLASQLAHLNGEIATVSTSGQQPNDLLDQRGQLLNQLSKLTNINYTTGPANSVDVYIGSHPLVTGEHIYGMTTTQIAVPGTGTAVLTADQPIWQDTGSPVQSQSGSLAGNMALLYNQTVSGSTGGTVASGYLTGYSQKLDALAQGVISTVNTGQANGLNLFGTQSQDTSGKPLPFFNGTSAGTIQVNSVMTPNLIAAVSQPPAGGSFGAGDGSNAAALYTTLTNGTMTIGSSTSTTLSGYYQSLVGHVGLDGQSANNAQTDGQATLTSLQNDLQAVTGVDLNQQSVNMIQEQQSYMAAAKLVATQQTLIQSLLAAVS